MRTVLLFLTFLVTSFTTLANADDDAKGIVQKWNELHNTHDLPAFSELYASQVLFYGKNYSNQKCVLVKDKLLSAGFQQEIITPVTVKYFSSGTIKCEFTKRTRANKTVKEHLCYLLIKKDRREIESDGRK